MCKICVLFEGLQNMFLKIYCVCSHCCVIQEPAAKALKMPVIVMVSE